jgi:hypothetical protein
MQAPELWPERRGRQALACAGLSLVAAHVLLVIALRRETPLLDSPHLRQAVRIIQEARGASPRRATAASFGSSRTQDGFNPAVFMDHLQQRQGVAVEAYNLAHVGSGALRSWVLFHRLVDRDGLPDVLYVELVPLLSNGPGDGNGLSEHLETHWLYPREQEELRRRGWLPPPAEDFWTHWITTPWYGSRSPLLRHVAPRWLDTIAETVRDADDRGWYSHEVKTYPSPEWERRLEDLRRQFQPGLQDFRPNPAVSAALHELLAECERHGVRAVLVLMPEGPRFRSFYSPAAAASLEAFARHLAAEHHAELVNARAWLDDEGLFSDSHHLRCDGAALFTQRLADETAHLLPRW